MEAEEAMTEDKNIDDIVDRTVAAVDEAMLVEKNLIKLSSGVLIRVKQVPPLSLIKVMARFRPPDIPKYFNKTIGREMENDQDPDYKMRLNKYNADMGNAMMNVLVILGTELVHVPDNLPPLSDENWVQEYIELGIGDPKPNSPNWLYLNWMMVYAIKTEEDLEKIQEKVKRLSGVPESAVTSGETFLGRDEENR